MGSLQRPWTTSKFSSPFRSSTIIMLRTTLVVDFLPVRMQPGRTRVSPTQTNTIVLTFFVLQGPSPSVPQGSWTKNCARSLSPPRWSTRTVTKLHAICWSNQSPATSALRCSDHQWRSGVASDQSCGKVGEVPPRHSLSYRSTSNRLPKTAETKILITIGSIIPSSQSIRLRSNLHPSNPRFPAIAREMGDARAPPTHPLRQRQARYRYNTLNYSFLPSARPPPATSITVLQA